jgi:hypothetical protein
MPKGILIVQSHPADPSVEDEYNDWYTNTHLPEVCSVPGVVGARRYRRLPGGRGDTDPPAAPYIAVYDLDADDLGEAVRELGARSADGRVTRDRVLQLDPPPIVSLYELIE